MLTGYCEPAQRSALCWHKDDGGREQCDPSTLSVNPKIFRVTPGCIPRSETLQALGGLGNLGDLGELTGSRLNAGREPSTAPGFFTAEPQRSLLDRERSLCRSSGKGCTCTLTAAMAMH